MTRVKLIGNSKRKLKKHLGSPSSILLSDALLTPSFSSIRRVRATLNRLMILLPIKNTCLIAALTGRRLLQKENLGKGELYIGIRQDSDSKSGWITHAWLTCGTHDLVGCKEKNSYGILGLFQDTI